MIVTDAFCHSVSTTPLRGTSENDLSKTPSTTSVARLPCTVSSAVSAVTSETWKSPASVNRATVFRTAHTYAPARRQIYQPGSTVPNYFIFFIHDLRLSASICGKPFSRLHNPPTAPLPAGATPTLAGSDDRSARARDCSTSVFEQQIPSSSTHDTECALVPPAQPNQASQSHAD